MEIGTSLQAFITLPFLLLIICCGVLTSGFKHGCQTIGSKIAPWTPDKLDGFLKWTWEEFILPIAPIVFGVLIGIFFHDFPVPDEISGERTSLIYFGCGGFMSSFLYPRLKYFIKKLKTDIPDIETRDNKG